MPAFDSKHYLGLAALVASMTADASETEDIIAECARIASTGDRILCLESALRQLAPAAEGEAVAALPDLAPERAAAAVAETTATMPATAGKKGSVEASAPAPVASAGEEAPELGAEQVARQNDVEEETVRVSARIVDHELVGTGRLRLTLDNGQVWIQTGDDDDRIARKIRGETDIPVEMWQSRSGGYRMHLPGIDRTMRVRRLQ